ncbi:hypothetical protein CIK05_07385 [Bdellovibrio sp. qaytius]|nr:hypothetical protein CIK05_07385 [Bdellovibrio sp. qaytius]
MSYSIFSITGNRACTYLNLREILLQETCMKKALFIGLAPLMFATQVMAATNTIQLTVNQQDLAHYRDKPEKYEFTGAQLQLNNNPAVALEEMETRGQGSIAYKRRNFGLKTEQKIQVGRIDSKKINLLSMSADPGYISTRLGLMTAELLQIGAAQPTEYVEVFINGKTNGLYSMVAKPKATLDSSPYVVRRGYKSRLITEEAEISKKLSPAQVKEIEAALATIYGSIATKSGQALFSSLKQVMDIDAYMRWMVMNSLYTNGDFPDEIFFYVDAEMYKQGRIFFRVMPWDFDDLFKEMHGVLTNKTEAAKPENKESILYSYEDKLDRSFSPANAYMYEQLKATARQLLPNQLSTHNTDQLLAQIRAELYEYAGHNGIVAMTAQDSGRKGVAYTAKEISDLFIKRRQQIESRRAYLLERIK